jgi:hypothetical protein
MFFYDFYHIAHYYIDLHLGGAFQAKIVFFSNPFFISQI